MKQLTRPVAMSALGFLVALLATTPAWAGTVVHTMPNCTCCNDYVKYLQSNGFNVSSEPAKDVARLGQKDSVPTTIGGHKYGPKEMEICHLMEIDGYVIVGHVPVAVIRRLLREKPHIRGIILPGMPAGSPGMGGKKKGPLVVYAFDGHGKNWVYATI